MKLVQCSFTRGEQEDKDVTSYIIHAAWCTLNVTCYKLHVTRYMLQAACYVLHVLCNMLGILAHTQNK